VTSGIDAGGLLTDDAGNLTAMVSSWAMVSG